MDYLLVVQDFVRIPGGSGFHANQHAASLAIGAQSLNWAKYALMASVAIGLIGLVFASISAWYAVFPTSTAQSPGSVAEAIHAPGSVQPAPAD